MSRQRWSGFAFGLVAFLAICAAALFSTLQPSSYFSGAKGIETAIELDVGAAVAAIGGRVVGIDGRDVTVELPSALPAGASRDAVEQQLRAIDGVRKLTVMGDVDAGPEPGGASPTEAPTGPTTPPTPATAVPTAAPEPTATSIPQTPGQVVAAVDLSGVEFEPGTAQLRDADRTILDAAGAQLAGLSEVLIEVQAHTDDEGDPDVNVLLSQQRAEVVVAYLIERGVDPSVLTAMGYGGALPIADNSTEQGRAANQRVALVVEGN